MKREVLFISESVTEGHPDKLCDQISDAVLDHFLIQDPFAQVRVECAVSSAIVFIAAAFASVAAVDFANVARKVIQRIGYDQPDFNAKVCSILSAPRTLSPEKSRRFYVGSLTEQQINKIPVKNQVTLFGFACDQTPVFMPMPIYLAHKIARRLSEVRHQMVLPYLAPDGKVQVGVIYREGQPYRLHSIAVTANQKHKRKPTLKTLREDISERVIAEALKDEPVGIDRKTRVLVNPDGILLGGPTHHSGLTGRKNAIDTYGEYARHSGKALSGKDLLRIDRVGAYAARYAAKNIVAANLAARCELMLSYSIGQTGPTSLLVQTFGTGKLPDDRIAELLEHHFDFRLAGILKHFDLQALPARHPGGFFEKLAAYGHFGREDLDLPWEKTDKSEALSAEI
jgi:S-adenosylmethionine synthetase